MCTARRMKLNRGIASTNFAAPSIGAFNWKTMCESVPVRDVFAAYVAYYHTSIEPLIYRHAALKKRESNEYVFSASAVDMFVCD